MITVEEIAGRITGRSDYDFDNRRYNWRPLTTDDYILPCFHIPESNVRGSRAKLKTSLSKVLAFIDSIKRLRAKNTCTILPISVTSKPNLLIWGSPKNITNGIAFMKKIGLISPENENYRFRAFLENENTSKTYRYYAENEEKLKRYCLEHGIEKYEVKNTVYHDSNYRFQTETDRWRVRFSSKLRLVKPNSLSRAAFEKELTFCLYMNYPGLRFYIEKSNEINETYYRDYPELRIRFQPNFTWSKDGTYVKGIGIRATNSLVNTKKEERKEILHQYGFTLEKDINASVPRMTLSLNSGHWVDESKDIYELIFRHMEPEGKFTSEVREAIKKLHMRAYFDNGDKLLGHHTWLAMDQENIDKADVSDTMCRLRRAIEQAEGGYLYGNEIFYVESCVYLMTLYDLLSSGHRVWQMYDCFYSTGDETQEEFEHMVSEGVRINFNEFMSIWYQCAA